MKEAEPYMAIYVYIEMPRVTELRRVRVESDETAVALVEEFPRFIYFYAESNLEGVSW